MDDAPQKLHEIPPELAQKYEVLGVLGSGGMGAVYKVRNRLSNHVVALKVLLTDRSGNSTAVLRFKREAEAASKLSHQNVVAINDFGIADEVPYLLMEYVPGHSLADVIATEKLVPERFRRLFLQTCEGLSHAHRNGVVHRDLKPSNILISQRPGEPETSKIADFGIAKVTTDGTTQHLTKTGDICGSPLYMSPEQCIGQPADERSDIFSLGCVMYEAITGHVPNAGENTLETIHRRTTERARSFNEHGITYPEWIERIIMRCLERDPEMRYAGVEELKADLQQGVANRSTKAGIKRLILIAAATLLVGIPPVWLSMVSVHDPFVAESAECRKYAEKLVEQNNYKGARKFMKQAFKLLCAAPESGQRDKETVAFMRDYTKLYAIAQTDGGNAYMNITSNAKEGFAARAGAADSFGAPVPLPQALPEKKSKPNKAARLPQSPPVNGPSLQAVSASMRRRIADDESKLESPEELAKQLAAPSH